MKAEKWQRRSGLLSGWEGLTNEWVKVTAKKCLRFLRRWLFTFFIEVSCLVFYYPGRRRDENYIECRFFPEFIDISSVRVDSTGRSLKRG